MMTLVMMLMDDDIGDDAGDDDVAPGDDDDGKECHDDGGWDDEDGNFPYCVVYHRWIFRFCSGGIVANGDKGMKPQKILVLFSPKSLFLVLLSSKSLFNHTNAIYPIFLGGGAHFSRWVGNHLGGGGVHIYNIFYQIDPLLRSPLLQFIINIFLGSLGL
jgi:hypothetical protein